MYESQQELDTMLLWKAFGVFYSFTAFSGFTGSYSLPGGGLSLLSYTHVIMLCLIIWLIIFSC